jgi:hypothetical protein
LGIIPPLTPPAAKSAPACSDRQARNDRRGIAKVAPDARDVGDHDVRVGLQCSRDGAGGRIGVAVQRLAAGCVQRERGNDGDEAGIEQRTDGARVDGFDRADEAEVDALDRAGAARAQESRRPLRRRRPRGRRVRPGRGRAPCSPLPHRTYSTTSRLAALGDAQPGHPRLDDPFRPQLGIDLGPAAVDEHDAVAARREGRDLVQDRVLGPRARHRVPSIFEDDQHAGAPSQRGSSRLSCIFMHSMYNHAVMIALPAAARLRGRNLLRITDLGADELASLLTVATTLKERGREQMVLLRGKTLVMLFEKPSLRTRVSFEAGMTQLGGHAIAVNGSDVGIGTRETPEDAARVLSRYGDAIVYRTHAHEPLAALSPARRPCRRSTRSPKRRTRAKRWRTC